MRRALGLLLSVTGTGILLGVGFTYARGALAREHARTEWQALEAHDARLAADRRAGDAPPRAALAIGAPVARLIIPAIRLDEVVIEGVGAEQLNAAPGHLPGSPLPGDSGNAVISAHRDRHFHSLNDLALGDTVITETLYGRHTWVVVSRHVVRRQDPALFPTATPTLTLTTCWPIRYIGPAPDRLIVTAVPVRGA